MPFGHAKSNEFNGYFYDEGAHICHSKDAEWLKKIDAENKCVFQKSIVKNFYSGRFINYPIQDNLRDLIPEEREKALNSAIKELSRKKLIANNYYEWCKNQYGAYITEKFYRTFTDKYWRTNMEDLSIDWLGGRLLKTNLKRLQDGAMTEVKSNAAFNKFYYPKEKGFGNLFKNLIDINRVKLNKEATKINALCILDNGKALDISQLAALIKDSTFVIANDTGPAHMAAHLGSKGIALFGSHTSPFKVSIERENFKSIQAPELSKLSAEKVFERLSSSIS